MKIAPVHLRALQALGYTEVEARFLYLVATHSSYFTARQFLSFAGAHWGKRTTTFWNKLQTLRHARTECFPKGGVVRHLFSRRLYRLIEKENLRNRREHEFDFTQRRIAISTTPSNVAARPMKSLEAWHSATQRIGWPPPTWVSPKSESEKC